MNVRFARIAALCALAVLSEAAVALPTCEQLATNPAYGLAGNPQVSGLTTVLLPGGVEPPPFPGFPGSPFTGYCKVDFTFSGESGPSAGYLPGQSQQLKIRVGLPPNSVDITSPSAAGAVPWNGRNRDLGGGGYAGSVGSVSPSTNLGYVGSSTDTGHSGAGPFGGPSTGALHSIQTAHSISG